MPDSSIALTSGSGSKNARTFSRVIGGSTVEEQAWFIAEPATPSFEMPFPAVTPTAGLHLVEATANQMWHIYLEWVGVYQLAPATTAAIDEYQIVQCLSSGLENTLTTLGNLDSTDPANIASASSAPYGGPQGTEVKVLDRFTCQFTQTIAPQAGGQKCTLIGEWGGLLRSKPIRVPSSNSNIAIKAVTARPGASVMVVMRFNGSSY